MVRPSPRTLGKTVDPITGEEVFFTKFGTQQLKFIDPAKPALGVKQLNVGQTFKGFTTGLVREITGLQHPFGAPTVRDTAYPDLTITKGVETTTPDPFPPKEKCTLDDDKPFCAITQAIGGDVCECPDWFTGKVTDPTAGGRGCECEACKNGTGQCSATVPECDAWDLLCEGTGGASVGIVGGTDVWLWVKIILVVIGIGVLLWLLRPLFGFAKSVTEAKSAVTRVNGLK